MGSEASRPPANVNGEEETPHSAALYTAVELDPEPKPMYGKETSSWREARVRWPVQ